MKPYRDVFGNPLSQKDTAMAVQATVMTDQISTMSLSRSTGFGVGKTLSMIKLLVDAQVVTPDFKVLFKGFKYHDAALNAALRQLRKGKK